MTDTTTDPKLWVRDLPIYWLTMRQFGTMPEYSTTLPTGKTIGKRWKRYLFGGPEVGRWVMCEYVPDPDPKYIGIKNYRIAVDGREFIDSSPHEFGTLEWKQWFETLGAVRGQQAIDTLPTEIQEKIGAGGWPS